MQVGSNVLHKMLPEKTEQKIYLSNIVFVLIFLSIAISPYNIYFPIGTGFDVALSSFFLVIVGFLLVMDSLMRGRIVKFRSNPVRIWMWLVLYLCIVILYSPNQLLGLKYVYWMAPPIIIPTAFDRFAEEFSLRKLHAFLKVVIFTAVPSAIAVIMFRLFPSFEEFFYRISAARLLVEKDTLSGFLEGAIVSNILDASKSGGWMINGNVACVYMGMLFWSSYAVRLYSPGLKWSFFMYLYLFAAFMTGSKAGLFAIVVSWVAVRRLEFTRINGGNILKLCLTTIFAALVLFFLGWLWEMVSSSDQTFFTAIMRALIPRIVIWGHFFEQFPQHPILGLGFGGWDLSFAEYAKEIGIVKLIGVEILPAHNIFIIMWAHGGSLALILLGMFFVSILHTCRKTHGHASRIPGLYLLATSGACLVLLIQGMGENMILLTPYISILLGLLLGGVGRTKSVQIQAGSK